MKAQTKIRVYPTPTPKPQSFQEWLEFHCSRSQLVDIIMQTKEFGVQIIFNLEDKFLENEGKDHV